MAGTTTEALRNFYLCFLSDFSTFYFGFSGYEDTGGT